MSPKRLFSKNRILERINIISKLKSFNESKKILKQFYAVDNIFGKNLVDSTLLALRAFYEKLSTYDLIELGLENYEENELVHEQAKDSIIVTKNSNGEFKSCIEMHDMLYFIETSLPNIITLKTFVKIRYLLDKNLRSLSDALEIEEEFKTSPSKQIIK
ncbi:13215_t:CDS:2 [Entrophospora sp. SA101]|nr:13215_t:CDS:2 [Entrophospora sp. SA101]